jgi:hypothetical protein
MHAAGEDARLDWRAIVRGTYDGAPIDAAMKAAKQAAPFRVRPDEAGERHPPPEGRQVIGRVAGSPGDRLGGVVLENQDRGLSRDPRDLAVDELVGNQITDHEDAAARETVDERQQTLLALGIAWQRVNRPRDQHFRLLKIHPAASARLLTTASAASPS